MSLLSLRVTGNPEVDLSPENGVTELAWARVARLMEAVAADDTNEAIFLLLSALLHTTLFC